MLFEAFDLDLMTIISHTLYYLIVLYPVSIFSYTLFMYIQGIYTVHSYINDFPQISVDCSTIFPTHCSCTYRASMYIALISVSRLLWTAVQFFQ